jgi:heat shock protein HslJ
MIGVEMKNSIKTIMVILLLGILVAGCSTTQTLNGTSWRLTRLSGQAVLTETEVTLIFAEDSLGGNDGCNSYGGSYTSESNTINIGEDIVSTMMYCNDQIQTQTNAFYQSLRDAATFKIAGGKLSLEDMKGTVLAEFESFSN